MGNARPSIFPRKNSPKIFWAQALIRGQKPSVRHRPHSAFPINHAKTPVNRPSPSKGYNPLHQPPIRPQIAPFHFGPFQFISAYVQPTHRLFRPKTPLFQSFLGAVRSYPRIFRDQSRKFPKFSWMGKGFVENMARILGGGKGAFSLRGVGGSLFLLSSSRGPPLQAVGLSSCPSLLPSLWVFLEHCNFWPFLGTFSGWVVCPSSLG